MKRQRGVGLIEVLIAMLVFAVGAVALVKLQGELIQGGSNANARSVALSIAQEKLDDLRAFQCKKDDKGTPQSFCSSTDTPLNPLPAYYSDIAKNTGGRKKADGSLELPSGDIARGNMVYALEWGISGDTIAGGAIALPVIYDAATQKLVEGAPGGNPPRVKRVRVSVSWTDPNVVAGSAEDSDPLKAGGQQTVTLEDQMNEKPPASVALGMEKDGGSDLASINVVDVQKESGGVSTGTGQEQLTLDPSLQITQNDQFVTTYFETVTFAGDSKIAFQREENLIINCECKQSGSGEAYEPARSEVTYDANGKATGYGVRLGKIVNKPVGKRIETGQSGQQNVLCDDCCRDHHDKEDITTNNDNRAKVYDPWRPNGNDSNGNPYYLVNHDHSHFYPNNSGVLVPANGSGDIYLEACRMQRVGGSFYVMQDWNLASIKVMPECFLEGGCPLGSGVSGSPESYEKYVTQFIKDYIDALDQDNPYQVPWQDFTPLAFPIPPVFADEPDVVMLSANETMQMVSSGLYIDYLTKKEIIALQNADSNDPGFLGLVPFEVVNVTKLANWSSTATDQAAVTNEPVKNDDKYSRGFVTALKGEPFVTSTLQLSNTGFLGFETLLKLDEDDGISINDSLQIKVIGGVSGGHKVAIMFVDGVNPNTPNSTGVQLAGPPVATCALLECTLDANNDGKIQVTGYNGNSAANERKVCYKTTIPDLNIVSKTVSGSSTGEITTFEIDNLGADATLTIDIVKQNDSPLDATWTCI